VRSRANEIDVWVERQGKAYSIGFVVTDDAWNDVEIVNDFEVIRQDLAVNTFGGAPVKVRLLNTLGLQKKELKDSVGAKP
jgi:hypothetical protein